MEVAAVLSTFFNITKQSFASEFKEMYPWWLKDSAHVTLVARLNNCVTMANLQALLHVVVLHSGCFMYGNGFGSLCLRSTDTCIFFLLNFLYD